MNEVQLPCGGSPEPVPHSHFPALFQAVIWRNWGLIPVARLAKVLQCTENELLCAAQELGLPVPAQVNPVWLERGYLTIIRNNWHLLPYEQLLQLLGWNAEQLAFALKEEDFLWHKLGSLKPDAKPVYYRALTEDEKAASRHLQRMKVLHFPKPAEAKPFCFDDFFNRPANFNLEGNDFELNFIYSYTASSGDFLLHREGDPFPEQLLQQYARRGIRGIWFHVILYQLFPIPGAEEFSTGHQERLDNLAWMVEKASRFGIGVYLYLNEPRCMPSAFYQKKPDWRGVESADPGIYSNCTSKSKDPLRWLSAACRYIFEKIPQIAGCFLITKSENPTHCHSHWQGDQCPLCSKRPVPEVISEIVSTVEKAVHQAAPSAKVIVWNWGWRREWEHALVDLLPRNIYLMCTSESGKAFQVGGISSEVGEYSISQTGPADRAVKLWEHAKSRGLKTVAKVQINNTWECPAVPYLPVPYLIREHLGNLRRCDVDGVMLSWTLGGYPGGNLLFLQESPEMVARQVFSDEASGLMCDAWHSFSAAFRAFPFHVHVLYYAPLPSGPRNLLYLEPTGYKASMVGFPYDDLERWCGIYTPAILEDQFQKLTALWEDGLNKLKQAEIRLGSAPPVEFIDQKHVARAAYCHFKSTLLQIRFVRKRQENHRAELMDILDQEIFLAKELYEIVCKDARIGFEASNHYFYTVNDLQEKVLNCEYLKQQLAGR
ncbi:MAG: hypothetical protein PHY82_04335, partial [Lentisphaeria bacterium]|nr:hypothetical protein [Lentisphaeria bacterium]